ncbi:MAG: right-handed parallel beta-helix repeat-containing protein [Kiritimatiellae bacterium]|nr:right-handed parallel beta-helix repeat-containing protein [Kiritimatiellia bacterium]
MKYAGIATLVGLLCLESSAQVWEPTSYAIGSPTTRDIWVDAINGNNANSGATSNLAVRTVTEAWNRIPMGIALTNGFRLRLQPGTHTSIPNYWESRYGTAAHPIILQAEGPPGSVILPDPNIFDCAYLYFLGIEFRKLADGGDAFHLEQCQFVLLRNCTIRGYNFAHETVKVNQCQNIYIEDCDISGAGDNAVDFVAVQYGHIVRSKIHQANDWALYVKGGSAQILIDGNEVYDAGTGGITAGQGTGFEFMTNPWLHYEAYDIKIANNVIHDTEGAGLGVNGGYNILLAYNTLVRVGSRSHVIEVVHGARGCDGNWADCENNRLAGGWGLSVPEDDSQYIPNRNVYIYNNIVLNPPANHSQWQQFAIRGATLPPTNSNIPSPSYGDINLHIRGNLIWNGPTNHPVLGDSTGCATNNPTCNESQLRAENHFNTLYPLFVNLGANDFRPAITGDIFRAITYPIPPFPGGDRPSPPLVPVGNLSNAVPRERNQHPRHQLHRPPGAYTGGASMKMVQIEPDSVSLLAEEGYTYALEASENGGSWTSFTTVSNALDPLLTAPVSAGPAVQLFRARLLPP